MFVKEIKKANGSTAICIVESIRDGEVVKQKIIRSLGQHKNPEQIEIIKKAAMELIVSMKNEAQPVLNGIEAKDVYQPIKRDVSRINIKKLKEEKRIHNGIQDIFGKIYEQLNFNTLLNGTRKDTEWNEILKANVFARVANPVSKRKSAKELENNFDIQIPLEKTYRMMNWVAKHDERIKKHILNTTTDLLKPAVDVMFFDVTTLYFESFDADEIREFGFSKDCKFKEIQVVLALVTDFRGRPITYELFPGNMYEGHTLIEIIKKLKNTYDVKNIFLVADRAMFTDANLTLMDSESIQYVVAAKLKTLTNDFKKKILSEDFGQNKTDEEVKTNKEFELKGRRLIVSYTHERAKKDKADRERLVARITKKVKNGKIKLSNLINNHGSKKYITVTGDDAAVINEEKIRLASAWDGLHGIITNAKEETANELLKRYSGLWKIEEAFRVNKHDLKMRPIYHFKPKRIKAHISICFIAYTLVNYALCALEDKKIKISFEQLRDELIRSQSSIIRDTESNSRFILPSKTTELQKQIYKAFDVERSEIVSFI